MSAKNVRAFLLRVQSDLSFYDQLCANPDGSLEEYSFTEAEREGVRSGDSLLLYRLTCSSDLPEPKPPNEVPTGEPPLPREPPPPPTRQEVRETIFKLITIMHNWGNSLRFNEAPSDSVLSSAKTFADQVLLAEPNDRHEMLIKLLMRLDGREGA
jgi:hypothetical protein